MSGEYVLLRTLLVCSFVLLAGSPGAQPSFDCANAVSAVEEMICGDEALSALDRRLAERYAAALETVTKLDTGAFSEGQTLRAMQRGWIGGRDECSNDSKIRDCVKEAYHIREAELVAIWMLEKPVAMEVFNCGDLPANDVNVYFFATERPSIRIEYGDGVRAGWLIRSASGSKYETSSGGFFWQKGRDAIFALNEGQQMDCTSTR